MNIKPAFDHWISQILEEEKPGPDIIPGISAFLKPKQVLVCRVQQRMTRKMMTGLVLQISNPLINTWPLNCPI